MAGSSSSYPIWRITYGDGKNSHQALFVELEEHQGKARGTLLHVQGPDEDPLAERVSMWFESRKKYKAFESPSYKAQGVRKLVGTVDRLAYDELSAICKSVKPPVVPQNYHPKKPNCRSWINNVLYECQQKSVISFDSGYNVPTAEELLQI